MESCGHEFASCTCGKITELLSMGTGILTLFSPFKKAPSDLPDEVLSGPPLDQTDQSLNANLVVTSPPLASAPAKSKDRTRSHHRVNKKPKRKKGDSAPRSPSTNRGSREPSTVLEESRLNMAPTQPSYMYQDQTYSGESSIPSLQQPSFMQYTSPPYQNMQSPMSGQQAFGPYRTGLTFDNENTYETTYSPQPQAGKFQLLGVLVSFVAMSNSSWNSLPAMFC